MAEENANVAPEGVEGGGGEATVTLPQIRDVNGQLREMNATEIALAHKYGWFAKKPAAAKKATEGGEEKQEDETQDAPEREEPDEQPDEETASGLEVPFGVPEKFLEETTANVEAVGKLGKELGVAQDTVQTLADYAVELANMDESGVDLSKPDACLVTLMSRYGNEEGAKVVKDARAAVLRLGPKAAAFLDESQLGNSPAVLMALAAYQRGEFHLSPEAAQAELDKLTKGEDLRSKPYFNSDHKDHKLVRDRASLLYARVSKGKDIEAKPKAEAAKKDAVSASMAKLDEEIRLAILDPAYRDANHPKHRDAVDRATALYERRYRD